MALTGEAKRAYQREWVRQTQDDVLLIQTLEVLGEEAEYLQDMPFSMSGLSRKHTLKMGFDRPVQPAEVDADGHPIPEG